jgi:hypothetical protein
MGRFFCEANPYAVLFGSLGVIESQVTDKSEDGDYRKLNIGIGNELR